MAVDLYKTHDFFSGIGGTSTGLTAAGFQVEAALNHWKYAIEIHAENHPNTKHELADVWTADPRRFRPAGMAHFSPECRFHSQAKGKKADTQYYATDLWRNPISDPADDRSRLLMESVPHISAMAGYRYVTVENVTEVVKWKHFDRWLGEMKKLDYQWKLLFLNSQFFGTPQSRDRFFGVFWKKGEKAPDLDFRPRATCPRHGEIEAVQAWKQDRWAGKYNAQYVYACPVCMTRVQPPTIGAETVIDWSTPVTRIGDRDKPLSDLTIAKIRNGIKKFKGAPLTISYYGRENAVKPTDEPMPTVPTENKLALVMVNNGVPVWRTTEEPIPTVTTTEKHCIVMAYNGSPTYALSDRPMPTVTTKERHAIIEPSVDIEDVGFRMFKPRELADGTGFPQNYKLWGANANQVKGIGGAVDPHVIRWIGERILEANR